MRNNSTIVLLALILLTANSINAQFAFYGTSTEQISIPDLSSQTISFTQNDGQWDNNILFKAEADNVIIKFGGDEVSYLFIRDTDKVIDGGISSEISSSIKYEKETQLIKAQFVNANPNPEVIAEGRLPHYSNYFYGNDPADWHTYVASYSAIIYKDIWPGIDLKYYGNGKRMKYDFIVNPGANINQIKIRYEGVSELALANTGELQAQTKFGLVYENIPEIYQETDDDKISISGYYRLIEPEVFGFEIENYDPSLALVIDPALVYSTYLGGSGNDRTWTLTTDASGNVYVAGEVYSTDFPTVDPYSGSRTGAYDAFVSKLSSSGSSLTYSTYIGGSNNDEAWGIKVDDSGNIYVAGWTQSTDYPTANAYDAVMDGSYDGFITKLSSDGASLTYSTYFGGSDQDWIYELALDGSNCIYIAGNTYSTDMPTVNPYSASNSGTMDAFVAKFASNGGSLTYSTYIGGSDIDYCEDIAIDGSGNAYITGYTASSDFPTFNAYDDSYNSSTYKEVFVTKLSSDGDSLFYSTFLGGSANNYGKAVAIDNSGNAYVTGNTSSSDFPVLNAYDSTYSAEDDVFITKLSSDGSSLAYSTYISGDDFEGAYDIFVNSSGNAYLVGYTGSSDFPTVDAYDDSLNGSNDAFISVLSPEGNSLVYSTYFGGSGDDYAYSFDVDGSGNTYLTGLTTSSDFPTLSPYDGTYNGSNDCFISLFQIPVSVNENTSRLPGTYSLMQNYPNPFNNSTVINYSLIQDCHVTLKIYDLLGRHVESIVDENQQAGSYQMVWNADDVSSGVYFYRIEAGDYSDSRKMLLIK